MNNINILRCSFLALVGITGMLANLEEKIITKNTSLQCFEKPTLIKGASISYEWTFTGGFPTLTDQDIKDYPEEYSRGKDTGDINLLNFQNETKTNATCKPVVDGNLVPGKSYQILPFRPITNVSIKCDSDTVYGKPGNYNCTCKSLGGSPTPRLSFLLENINKSSEISDTIKFPIPLNCSDSLKLLKCIASQRYRQPEDLNDAFRFNITCPPYRSIHGPVTPKLPEEGSSFTLTICFRSNPKHFNSTWFYADNCCISMGDCDLKYSEPRYDLQQPKKVSEDSDEYCAVLNIDKVEKEDFGRHFFLYVTNSEGLAKFSHTIDKLKAEDGVNTTILAFLIIFVLLFLAMVAVALFLWKKGARSSPDGYSTTNDDHMMNPK